MELYSENVGDVVVARIKGDHLDAGTVDDFKAAAEPVLEKGLRVVFDLQSINFVDSSGIGAIISCLRKLNTRGGDLKLCGLSRPVRSLFELVRMHRIFEIFETSDEAVEAFTRS
jgi:anti-sigma B factor antagonist